MEHRESHSHWMSGHLCTRMNVKIWFWKCNSLFSRSEFWQQANMHCNHWDDSYWFFEQVSVCCRRNRTCVIIYSLLLLLCHDNLVGYCLCLRHTNFVWSVKCLLLNLPQMTTFLETVTVIQFLLWVLFQTFFCFFAYTASPVSSVCCLSWVLTASALLPIRKTPQVRLC